MNATQINSKIAAGTVITICPWDSAYTNQASATVLEVSENRVVRYQVDDCEAIISRPVNYTTWNAIVEQAK